LKRRASHQQVAVRRIGTNFLSNAVSQSVAYSAIPHWSTILTPAVLAVRGIYRTYTMWKQETRAVDAQLQEFCARLGVPYNY